MRNGEITATYREKDEKTGKVTKERKLKAKVRWLDTTLEEKSKLFGIDIVNSAVTDALVVDIQNDMRAWAGQGKNDAEVASLASAWKPRAKRHGKSAFDKAKDEIMKLDPELRKKLFREANA